MNLVLDKFSLRCFSDIIVEIWVWKLGESLELDSYIWGSTKNIFRIFEALVWDGNAERRDEKGCEPGRVSL